jgi:hypothetical protein
MVLFHPADDSIPVMEGLKFSSLVVVYISHSLEGPERRYWYLISEPCLTYIATLLIMVLRQR